VLASVVPALFTIPFRVAPVIRLRPVFPVMLFVFGMRLVRIDPERHTVVAIQVIFRGQLLDPLPMVGVAVIIVPG
jgi:hypothetical protein